MKKFLICILVLLMTMPAGFGSAEELEVKEGMRIGLSVTDLTNPYMVMLVNGMQERCDELGIELIVSDPKSDVSAQVTALENFITMQVDAIVVSALNPEACESVLQRARARGIKIITQSSRNETSDVWVSAEEYDMGYTCGLGLGAWLEEKFGSDSTPTVAVLVWDIIPTIVARGDGMIDGILEHVPGANIIRQNANTPALGQSVTDSLLQANPDLVGIACANDAGAIGAFSAAQAANKDNDDFCIGGIDATDEALAIIRTGRSFRYTVDLIPFENGRINVNLCVRLVNGEELDYRYVIPARLVTIGDLL